MGGTGEERSKKRKRWSPQEDAILMEYVNINGVGSWDAVANRTNLSHSGRSCRLRWYQHLSPRVRNDPFTPTEEVSIIRLHSTMGNNWAGIAAQLEAGRSDNQVKNYWNTRIKRCRRTGSPLYQQRQDVPVSHFFQSMELSSVQLEAVVADTNHQPSQENSSGLLQEVVDECRTRRGDSDDHQYHCSNFPITFNYNATVVDPFYQIDWGSMNMGEAVDLLSNEQASLFFFK